MPAFPIPSLPRSSALLLAAGVALIAGAAPAAPTAAPGYTLSVFAPPPSLGALTASQPDSIAVVGNDVFVGYGNGVAKDGSDGGASTIVEYSSAGVVLHAFSVIGHNDGLQYDSATGQLWALQNEDGNPNLALINPSTLTQSNFSMTSVNGGGGFDDVAFGPNGTFISASNPFNNPNTDPAIVTASLGASTVNTTPALLGNATATLINSPGGQVTLNLTDPDSLIFGPNGQLVLDSQADQQLVFISNAGTASQTQSVLKLANEVDDTVFGNGTGEELLFADLGSGTVYALKGAFGSGQAFSAADTLNEIVNVNQTDGSFTPLVTGLSNPHGEAFFTEVTAAIPEPATWAMLLVGVGVIGAALRLDRKPIGLAALA